MLVKVKKFEHIGKFSKLTQDREFQYGEQNCNIIFGFNGSGKTTLSNVISLFADNSFISEDEKKAIFDDIKNNDSAAIELVLNDKSSIKYNPDNHPHSKDIYVFNSHFISTHVFDGTKGRLKKFSNAVSGEIKNEAIEEANIKIIELESKKKKLENENTNLDERLKIINQTYSSSFSKTLTDKNKRLTVPNLSKEPSLPLETIDKLQQELITLAADYDLSKKQQDLAVDLDTLGKLIFNKSDLDLSKINTALNKSVQQLSKEMLEKKIKEVKDLFSDDTYKQNTEQWFRFGKSVLDRAKVQGGKTKCPICNTDISTRLNDILQDFNGYFDEGYESFISELKKYKEQVQTTIDLIEKYITESDILKKLLEKYKSQISEQIFTVFDFNAVKMELDIILKACDSKLADIQFSFNVSQDTIDKQIKMNSAVDRFNELKNNCLNSLSAKKLETHKVEEEIRDTYKKMVLLEFDKFDKGGNFEKYKQNKINVEIIDTKDAANNDGLLFWHNKRREELKKIKVESKSISKFLKIMGIDHFIVDINEYLPEENIIIKYNSSNTDKNKLRNCLSDGEKQLWHLLIS